MPRYSKLSRSKASRDAFSITSTTLLDFLTPAEHISRTVPSRGYHSSPRQRIQDDRLESYFFSALSRASTCPLHRVGPSRVHLSGKDDRKARFSKYYKSLTTGVAGTTGSGDYLDHAALQDQDVEDSSQSSRFQRPYRNSDEQRFASSTRLPQSFFYDVDFIRTLVPQKTSTGKVGGKMVEGVRQKKKAKSASQIQQQMKLLQSVRELEEKLAKAKQNLAVAAKDATENLSASVTAQEDQQDTKPIVLSKEDYKNLVDLYFYSHNSRFSPESSDASPNPLFLNDYSFQLSADFSKGGDEMFIPNEDENYQPLSQELEKMLRKERIKELSTMQLFVDLLLDDKSSNRALFDAYQQLPRPGVAHLPRGVVRLFLQRMSTPLTTSEKSMLRYLSLMDDMQEAKLPITLAEWSSAIYLAGRSFSRVTQAEVSHSFTIWRQMENNAGVQASSVTFNILFDIAVRAGRFALGETILKEMHARNLRLNRLGRVSLMYYHGMRGDGDGVRKAYHDFVEAGEIVDTLVLNCVIASLINAQEPTAADQIYQRMKDLQLNHRKGVHEDGTEALFRRYPGPGSDRLEEQMASNSLGRILEQAPRLRGKLPDHHAQLQASMPLTPDIYTYRSMVSYHATVSGDLDRLTVLLNDMLEIFQLPVHVLIFQFLFKGFAIHGPRGGPDSKWSKKKLDLVWDACRHAIKSSRKRFDSSSANAKPTLPSIRELHDLATEGSELPEKSAMSSSEAEKLTPWQNLVLDLANFPKERIVRIQRFHSEQFDDETKVVNEAHSDSGPHSSFFQKAHYDAPAQGFDHEEGEYVLPNPVASRLMDPTGEFGSQMPLTDELYDPSSHRDEELYQGPEGESDDYDVNDYGSEIPDDIRLSTPDAPGTSNPYDSVSPDSNKTSPSQSDYDEVAPHLLPLHHNPSSSQHKQNSPFDNPSNISVIYATRPMICWLLRAYARVTNDRRQVEEVWNSARKIWSPHDEADKISAIRVLHRCLRDCDRARGMYFTDR